MIIRCFHEYSPPFYVLTILYDSFLVFLSKDVKIFRKFKEPNEIRMGKKPILTIVVVDSILGPFDHWEEGKLIIQAMAEIQSKKPWLTY
jgi:hypothetical protein